MSLTKAGVRALNLCAPAKINLFLHVGEKREDGFHALESLAVFVEAGDRLDFAPAERLEVKIGGPFARALSADENNLVLRTARALAHERTNLGASIAIEKNLPVAAGLGGGSADAGATLRALNVLWGLELGEAELLRIAATLGSDVPACLLSRPVWMEGRGEKLTKTPAMPQLAMVLVNPGVEVPTARVFERLNARTGLGAMEPPPASIQSLWDVVAYLSDAENDLEAPACEIAPEIEHVLETLWDEPGCVAARMTGSGATCFGLFENGRYSALPAAESIAHAHPSWWVRATRIAGPDIGAPHWNGE